MAKKDEKSEEEPPKKGKLGLIIGIVVGSFVLVGGIVAGVILGPKLMGAPAQAEAKPEVEKSTTPEKIISAKFEPIIIDIRGRRGEVHHLKVRLAAELKDGIIEDDFMLVRPRGREAALTYLRTLSFKEVTNPKKYETIKDELSKRIIESVGEKMIHRVLLVDFVAQ